MAKQSRGRLGNRVTSREAGKLKTWVIRSLKWTSALLQSGILSWNEFRRKSSGVLENIRVIFMSRSRWKSLLILSRNETPVYEFAQAAVTNTTDWGASTREINFLTILEAESPLARCWQVWFLLRSLSLTCRRPSSCCSSHGFPSVRGLSWCSFVQVFSSYKDTSLIALGPSPEASFYFHHLSKALSPNTVIFWDTRG